MKISKKGENISDDNDKFECVFKFKDIKKYVVQLKYFLASEKEKLTIVECGAISSEIEAWDNFFYMMKQLKVIK